MSACKECGCEHGCVCDYDVPTNLPAPSSLAAPSGSAHTGISPALKAKYDALPKSEQEKLTGRWLVENIPQVTDPALVEVLDEISAPNS